MTPAIAFLRQKYGQNFEGELSVWSKQSKKTSYFCNEEWDQLASTIEELSKISDVYVALGTQIHRLPPNKRGGADSIIQVPGFIADIDFANQKDSNKHYPDDSEQALDILSAFPIEPTTLVNTGNGIHAHYDFEVPFVAKNATARAKIKKLVAAFQRKLIEHFRKNDRDIDNVGDLCRLYRIPATLNHKSSPPKPVQIISSDTARKHSVEFYEEFVARKATHTSVKQGHEPANKSHETIVEKCSWYRLVVTAAASCDEPNWYAAASITARCQNGQKLFHQYSSKHARYNEREASQKFERALTEAGPRTCASIETVLGFTGCAVCPHHGKIKSPVQLGEIRVARGYEAAETGPLILGYTGSEFVFRNQQTQEVVRRSSILLSIPSGLLELAPKKFWEDAYPRLNKDGLFTGAVDWLGACDGLIQACRAKGVIEISSIRGIGVWTENATLVVNLGGETIESKKFIYTSPKRIQLLRSSVSTDAILAFLKQPSWITQNAAELLLGWAFTSVLCGVSTAEQKQASVAE